MKTVICRSILCTAGVAFTLFSHGLTQGDQSVDYGSWQGRMSSGQLITISTQEQVEYGNGTSLSLHCFGGETSDLTSWLYGFDGARFDGFRDISMRVATKDGPVDIALAPSDEVDQLLIDPEPSNLVTLIDAILAAASDYEDLRLEVTVGYFSEVQVFDTYGFMDALNDLPCYPRFREASSNVEQSDEDTGSGLSSSWQRQSDFVYTMDSNEDGVMLAGNLNGSFQASIGVPSIPSQGLGDTVEVRYTFDGGDQGTTTETETWYQVPDSDFISLIASSNFNSVFSEFGSEDNSSVEISVEILNSDNNTVYEGSFSMTGFTDAFEQLE